MATTETLTPARSIFKVTQSYVCDKTNEQMLEDFREFQKLMLVTGKYQYELTSSLIKELFAMYDEYRANDRLRDLLTA